MPGPPQKELAVQLGDRKVRYTIGVGEGCVCVGSLTEAHGMGTPKAQNARLVRKASPRTQTRGVS